MKLLMCSSAWVPSSGLNLGSHFSGASGNACNGAGILTAPGLVHGSTIVTAIVDDITVELAEVWEGVDIKDCAVWDVAVANPWWTTMCDEGVHGWLRTGEGEMEDVDESSSLSDPSLFFFAFFLLGKGNSVGSILSFLLAFEFSSGWGRQNSRPHQTTLSLVASPTRTGEGSLRSISTKGNQRGSRWLNWWLILG